MKSLLVLDSLFDDLILEAVAASSRGWSLARWTGSEDELRTAEVIAHVRTNIDAGLLSRMPACRVVSRFGTGLDSVDLHAASALGISVVNVRDYCIPELASHTLALALSLQRLIGSQWDNAKEQEHDWQSFAARGHPEGRHRATVIGLGSIGRVVTAALIGLQYDVAVVTKHGADEAQRLGARSVAIDEGIAHGDLLLLHTSLEPSTTRMIDSQRLNQMPESAILVNTARIGLLDEQAVATALERGQLSGLGLDARLGPDSPLRPLLGDRRVLVTPHIGWYSERSANLLRHATIIRAIDAFEGGLAQKT